MTQNENLHNVQVKADGTLDDLLKLLDKSRSGQRADAEAVIEIQDRHLWICLRHKSDGSQLYKTFVDFLEEVMGHTPSWVSKARNWLAVWDVCDKLKITPLTMRDAQAFPASRYDAEAIESILTEAVGAGLSLDLDTLRAAIDKRLAGGVPVAAKPAKKVKGKIKRRQPKPKTYTSGKPSTVYRLQGSNRIQGLLREAASLLAEASQTDFPLTDLGEVEALTEECQACLLMVHTAVADKQQKFAAV